MIIKVDKKLGNRQAFLIVKHINAKDVNAEYILGRIKKTIVSQSKAHLMQPKK